MQSKEIESHEAWVEEAGWLDGASPNARWLAASEKDHVLFGMDWIALVGGAPVHLARKHIRLYRASMHTSFNPQSAVVGLATEVDSIPTGVAAYSAAALFAAAYQQDTVACLVTLKQGQCWMVAVHQGKVLVQTDRWFEDLVQARQAVESIEQRFPLLRLYSHHLGERDVMPAWACPPYPQDARLTRTQALLSPARHMIVGAAILMTLATYIWINHDQSVTVESEGESDARLKLMQHWQDVISSQPVHGEEEVFKLVASWNQVPVFPGGWRLERIDCRPQSSHWHCVSAFRRIHVLASAESLIESLPHGWRPEFIPLDQASVSFSLEAVSHRLEPSIPTHPIGWITRLQKIRTAFENIQVGARVPIIHLNDLDRARHEKANTQAAALSWHKRTLQIRGPLRSIPMLRGWDMPGWWRQVSLELRDGDHAVPGKSRYMLTMTGEMYERKD